MPAPSEPRTLVLHALRLTGFADAVRVSELLELDPAAVAEHLEALQADGLVRHRERPVPGFALTPTGRRALGDLLAEELDAAGARPLVTASYQSFLPLNRRFLDVCTRWQLREVDGRSVVNDHQDAAHDAAVLAELAAIDGSIQPICRRLADALDRFRTYGPRLANALARVQGGDLDWFTKPTIASYHTVWFELHEDLLATLGLERSQEQEH